MKRFVIADPHFDHTNIIKYCDRPFANKEHMNNVLITNWNRVVTDDDIVYVVGDFSLTHSKERIRELTSQLKGHKYLVMGNHDYLSVEDYLDAGFDKVYDEAIIIDEFIIISHYPMFMTYNMPYFNIFGHVHNNPEYKDATDNSWCVSAERLDYTPAELTLDKDHNPYIAKIEEDYESAMLERLVGDLLMTEEEAERIGYEYMTLDELFEARRRIRTRLTNAYQAESNKQYMDKLIKQNRTLSNQTKDPRYLISQLKKSTGCDTINSVEEYLGKSKKH